MKLWGGADQQFIWEHPFPVTEVLFRDLLLLVIALFGLMGSLPPNSF